MYWHTKDIDNLHILFDDHQFEVDIVVDVSYVVEVPFVSDNLDYMTYYDDRVLDHVDHTLFI